MFISLNYKISLVIFLKRGLFLGHRPIIVKSAVLVQKVGRSTALYLSSKVFHDWSIICFRKRNHIYYIFAALF